MSTRIRFLAGGLAVLALLVLTPIALQSTNQQSTPLMQIGSDRSTADQRHAVTTNLSSMPLAFTENQGQWDEQILFRANAGAATMWFTDDGVYYQFTRRKAASSDMIGPRVASDMHDPLERLHREPDSIEILMIKASFMGANLNPVVVGEEEMEYKCNYFLGNDPSAWQTDVPNYRSICFEEIYPGIDLKYYGNGRQMEYDLIVSPGADPSQIRIEYEGANSLSINECGELVVKTDWGRMIEQRPIAYQANGRQRFQVGCEYGLSSDSIFNFRLDADCDSTLWLIIDPCLVFGTYLGGSGDIDGAAGIAVDQAGNTYITGSTTSIDFPTVNPLQGNLAGSKDIYVTKLNATGNGLVYSTYLGGTDSDAAGDIAVDVDGSAYVVGSTSSNDFPTVNPYQDNQAGADAFVAKLNATGNALVYCTYLGGSGWEGAGCCRSRMGIALHTNGNVCITGETNSADFPTENPIQATSPNSNGTAFVTMLNSAGTGLVYSTYLGGNTWDWGTAVALDSEGCAYITGRTYSPDFPTVNAFQGLYGRMDAFVTKLSLSGSELVYSTCLGGGHDDLALGVAVDKEGCAYVTGWTRATDFPTFNPFQAHRAGIQDAFITKFSPEGNHLVYSTYLGGGLSDFPSGDYNYGSDIAVDRDGHAYVTGYTSSYEFPTADPLKDTPSGYSDAFITKLSIGGSELVYSTYLGGSENDEGVGVAVDSLGKAYVVGTTNSADFPTANPFQSTLLGDNDAFIIKISPCDHDVAVRRILAPADTIPFRSLVTPQALVTNVGLNIETFPVIYKIASFYSDTFMVNSLSPSESLVVSFENWAADSAGSHFATCFSSLEGDQFRSNDTAFGSFCAGCGPELSVVRPARAVALGPTSLSCRGLRLQPMEGEFDTANVYFVDADTETDTLWSITTTVIDDTLLVARFDLEGLPESSIWDARVAIAGTITDHLPGALTIVDYSNLRPEDILWILTNNRMKVQTLQEDASCWTVYDEMLFDSLLLMKIWQKGPDMSRIEARDNSDTTQSTQVVITRGEIQYSIDQDSGFVYITDLFEESGLPHNQFLGQDYFLPESYAEHYWITVDSVYGGSIFPIFGLSSRPKVTDQYISHEEFHMDYVRGIVTKSFVYEGDTLRSVVLVDSIQELSGIWFPAEIVKHAIGTSIDDVLDTLTSIAIFTNLVVNAQIADSLFDIDSSKIVSEVLVNDNREFGKMPSLGKGMSFDGPFWSEWQSMSDYRPYPIVFVRGCCLPANDGVAGWGNIINVLDEHFNYDAYSYLNTPEFPDLFGSIDTYGDGRDGWADRLYSVVNNILAEPYPEKVNLVGYSMGGLVIREYITNSKYGSVPNKVNAVVTINTPHLGTPLANFASYFARGQGAVIGLWKMGFIRASKRILEKILVKTIGYFNNWIGTEAADDMGDVCPLNSFLDNLYDRPQYENVIDYHYIAGNLGSFVIIGEDDQVVSLYSQIGRRQMPWECGEFESKWNRPLRGAIVPQSHLTVMFAWETPYWIRRFLDKSTKVDITWPTPDFDLDAGPCTLRVALYNEYLPATTKLTVNITKAGEIEPILTAYTYFKPHPDWNSSDSDSLRGFYEIPDCLAGQGPGKYTILVESLNPGGIKSQHAVTVMLGVDLATEFHGGGSVRANFPVAAFGVLYENVGNSTAMDIQLTATLPPEVAYASSSPAGSVNGNTVRWDFDSLIAHESGQVLINVNVPWLPQNTILHASSSISTIDEDADLANNTDTVEIIVIGSWDPNDKCVNPVGYAGLGYIAEQQKLKYTIHFENVGTATAEAIYVTIVDTLSPLLDWETLKFGPVSHPEVCSFDFDAATGVVTWDFDSIMLPPNVNPPEGEGWVTYSIFPEYSAHGTQIRNTAAIQFDFNPWITAPEDGIPVTNTIDEYPPSSKVYAMPDSQNTGIILVQWVGSDDSLGFGSGIRDFSIYVSVNGRPDSLWLAEVTSTADTFYATQLDTVAFYSIARDSVGNVENPPEFPDAWTFSTCNCNDFCDLNLDGAVNPIDVVFIVNYVYLSNDMRVQPPFCPNEAGDANCDDNVNPVDVVLYVNFVYLNNDMFCADPCGE